MEWIGFSKQIPELNKSILAVDEEDGYMEVVDVQEIEGKLCICSNNGYNLFSDTKYTHWMILPKPPISLKKNNTIEIFSKEECIFHYCPHPEICKEKGCQCKQQI